MPASIVAVPPSLTSNEARQPAAVGSSAASAWFGKLVAPPASWASRSAFVIACPVRSPTWSSRLREAPPQRARR